MFAEFVKAIGAAVHYALDSTRRTARLGFLIISVGASAAIYAHFK